jgi:hypothetical protein
MALLAIKRGRSSIRWRAKDLLTTLRLRSRPPFSAPLRAQKGPAVSDGPLLAININRGTNELSFADQVGEVNISLDRLAFVQTYCTIFRVGRLR